MADVTKVLMDDHQRLRRMFNAFSWGSWDQALNICDELIIHTTIEEELIYPAVRDEIDEAAANQAEDDHAEIKELMAEIAQMDREDNRLNAKVKRLGEAVFKHVEFEEKVLFPKINVTFKDDLLSMGSQVFALRTELLALKPDRSGSRVSRLTANVGWGGGTTRKAGGTANVGW